MAEEKSEHGGLVVAGTALSGPEAEMMSQRLAEAGIQAIWQRTKGGPSWGISGAQYVYVEAEHLERAREVLEAGEGISEEELVRAEEEDAARRHLSTPPD